MTRQKGALTAIVTTGCLIGGNLVGAGILGLPINTGLAGENSILAAWETNLPATVPMATQIKSGLFLASASAFALIAISTSFLANGLGLQSFIRDMLLNTFNLRNRAAVIGLTFVPPLMIALVYPDIFLRALPFHPNGMRFESVIGQSVSGSLTVFSIGGGQLREEGSLPGGLAVIMKAERRRKGCA